MERRRRRQERRGRRPAARTAVAVNVRNIDGGRGRCRADVHACRFTVMHVPVNSIGPREGRATIDVHAGEKRTNGMGGEREKIENTSSKNGPDAPRAHARRSSHIRFTRIIFASLTVISSRFCIGGTRRNESPDSERSSSEPTAPFSGAVCLLPQRSPGTVDDASFNISTIPPSRIRCAKTTAFCVNAAPVSNATLTDNISALPVRNANATVESTCSRLIEKIRTRLLANRSFLSATVLYSTFLLDAGCRMAATCRAPLVFYILSIVSGDCTAFFPQFFSLFSTKINSTPEWLIVYIRTSFYRPKIRNIFSFVFYF